jgi:nucleoside-diphosphate-sugar epimerase
MGEHRNVLVTGAAGWVGQAVCRELLSRGHHVRGLDRLPGPLSDLPDFHLAELEDAAAIDRAAQGMDSIVHLAATPDDADFMSRLLGPNIIGVYNVCDAARRHNVRRLVLTSTMQVINGHDWRTRTVSVQDGPSVTNHYGVTKVFAEAMGQMYHQTHKLSVVVARLGWCPRTQPQWQKMTESQTARRIYLSPGDAGRFFACAVEAPDVGYALVFVTSRPSQPAALDLEPARIAVGFQPQDLWSDGWP